MAEDKQNTSTKWLLGLTIVFTYALLILGNVVTTTGSGLECPDWPLCHGSVNPPHFIGVWIEWSHRLLGGVTGILIIASAVYMIKQATGAVKFFMKFVIGLVVAVVFFGGLIVIIEAPLLDSLVRIGVVSTHIVIATMIFVAMIMAVKHQKVSDADSEKKYALTIFGIVYAQIFLGIIVRYGNASLACPDWPMCQGAVLPPNFTGEVMLHYVHRLVAYGIFGLTLWKAVKAFQEGNSGKNVHLGTFVIVLGQAIFGITTVLTQLFLPLVILHGAFGFLLLGWTAYQAAPYITEKAEQGSQA